MLTFFIILALLDTAFGNYYLPGPEGIVKTNNGLYRLYKWNRIMFIPLKMWDRNVGKKGMAAIVEYCLPYSWGTEGTRKLEDCKKFLTSSRKKKVSNRNSETGISEVVYKSGQETKNLSVSSEEVLQLTSKMVQAHTMGDTDKEEALYLQLETLLKSN